MPQLANALVHSILLEIIFSSLPKVNNLVDSLERDAIFISKFSENFARSIAGANLGIAIRFGIMFYGDRFFRKGNSCIKDVKYSLNCSIEGGYGCGSKARWSYYYNYILFWRRYLPI
jgi:hypothetical protein